jgi:hypothetical protein
VSTPDVCLIQGLPGSGKSRVVAEIIKQAVARGERVLLLAPAPPALDHVLQSVASSDGVFPVRCVDREESLSHLHPDIRALTYDERVEHLRSQALEGARSLLQVQEERHSRIQKEESIWPHLRELAIHCRNSDESREALRERRDRLASEVEEAAKRAEEGLENAGNAREEAKAPEASRFALDTAACRQAHREECARLDSVLEELQTRIESHRQELDLLEAQATVLQPRIEAKQHGRWWTKAWWQATLRLGSRRRWEELNSGRQQKQADLETLKEQAASVRAVREQAESTFQAERARLVQTELARRLATLGDEEATLQKEQEALRQAWQNACQVFGPDSPRPTTMTVTAVQEAWENWRRYLARSEEQRTFARQWAGYMDQAAEQLSERLPAYVNLVAATTTALPADKRFGDQAVNGDYGPILFDLLILEEADQITESELLNAVRRARRWVLVGEPVIEDRSAASGSGRGVSAVVRSPVLALARSGPFQRLWHHLHCDPRLVPYVWVREDNRLCCRLRPISAEQRQWIESEVVADFPDIELRIMTVPRGQPELVEVVFPPSLSIPQAKQFIFREVEELAVSPSGHSLRWTENNESVVLGLANPRLSHDISVNLEPGIRESLGLVRDIGGAVSEVWRTCCLEFDRSAGWHRQRAEAWVERYLRLSDLGRTVWLDSPHRMQPDLAAFVCSLLFADSEKAETAGDMPGLATEDANRAAGRQRAGGPTDMPAESARPMQNDRGVAVEFVPVPQFRIETPKLRSAREATGSLPVSPSGLRITRGGAGLELDLADPRYRDRLPLDLRSGLPKHGFVNYLEAQEIVRVLSGLAADSKTLGVTGEAGLRPTIAIIALYPGQAELIRKMVRRSGALANLEIDLIVGTPEAFRQREAHVVLMSLTRSHTHRAVAFGEGPQDLALAMTRAKQRLMIFGDPGTLVRRSQWEGPIDQLDEGFAARERQLITRLVRYLQGHGDHPGAFRLRLGNSS